MNKKKLGTEHHKTRAPRRKEDTTYPRPSWVAGGEAELCPDCFKVVGDRSRYNLVCMLGRAKEGMSVGELTEQVELSQPTVTHHLQVLKSVNAVEIEPRGRARIYKLNRDAHRFEDCKITYV